MNKLIKEYAKNSKFLIAAVMVTLLTAVTTYGFGVDDSGFGVTSMNLFEDLSPTLSADLNASEYQIDNVGNIIHDDATPSDWTLQSIDSDKDIVFSGNDGGVQTEILTLDVSAGALSGIMKATGSGVLSTAVADTDYLLNIVADTTPQLGATIDGQEFDLDNIGAVIHDDASPSDFTLQNLDQDYDIVFSGNDGGVQGVLMTLDVSEGALTGVLKASGSGVLTSASEGTDYYSPTGTDVAVTDGGTNLSTVAAGSVLGANAGDTISAITYTGSGGTLYNALGTISWKDSVYPYLAVADPCATFPEGTIFYNDASNYLCYCNGTNDVKASDDTTDCF